MAFRAKTFMAETLSEKNEKTAGVSIAPPHPTNFKAILLAIFVAFGMYDFHDGEKIHE